MLRAELGIEESKGLAGTCRCSQQQQKRQWQHEEEEQQQQQQQQQQDTGPAQEEKCYLNVIKALLA